MSRELRAELQGQTWYQICQTVCASHRSKTVSLIHARDDRLVVLSDRSTRNHGVQVHLIVSFNTHVAIAGVARRGVLVGGHHAIGLHEVLVDIDDALTSGVGVTQVLVDEGAVVDGCVGVVADRGTEGITIGSSGSVEQVSGGVTTRSDESITVIIECVGDVDRSELRELNLVQGSTVGGIGGIDRNGSAIIIHLDIGRSVNLLDMAVDHCASLSGWDVSIDLKTCQHYAYLAVGVLRLVSILLSTILAITHAEMTAVLLQGILLFSDALFLFLNLLEVDIGGILLQHENLFLEHLHLLSRELANNLEESRLM